MREFLEDLGRSALWALGIILAIGSVIGVVLGITALLSAGHVVWGIALMAISTFVGLIVVSFGLV